MNHSRLRNGRLGIEPPKSGSVLPPIAASSNCVHLSQQQQYERSALEKSFRERLQTQQRLYDFQPLHQALAAALNSESNTDGSSAEMKEREEREGDDDCFAMLKRSAQLLEGKFPFACQFLLFFVSRMQDMVQEKLREEADLATHHQFHHGYQSSPRREILKETGDVDDVDEDDESSSSESDETTEEDKLNCEPASSVKSPISKQPIPRTTFRNPLRSRSFLPTRVSPNEHIITKCEYTPVDQYRKVDISSISIKANGKDGGIWHVALFPKAKPSLSRPEIDALMQWAQSKLAAVAPILPEGSELSFDETTTQFIKQIELRELICYELSRLVFDKCPTTARFLHGLFVELTRIASRTIASAIHEAEVHDQRRKNVEMEQNRLSTKLQSLKISLEALEQTLHVRQRDVLGERERIIRQRKKLNLLLCADQVLIRSVIGLLQHGLDLADDLFLNLDEARGIGNVEISNTLQQAALQHGASSVEQPQFNHVRDLVELVATKYGNLSPVQRVKVTLAEVALQEGDEADTTEKQVIVVDMSEIKTAADEFKSTIRRLSRMVTSKSPDSSVGWEAQELWDQALFIPPHEEIQDLDRDVQLLCQYVERSILHRVTTQNTGKRHVGVQTDISACVTSQPRGRSNGFLSVRSSHGIDHITTGLISPTSDSVPHHDKAGGGKADEETIRLISEDHQELLNKFLPFGFRAFINEIPVDYVPHQFSLGVVHAIISFLFNEMWLLVKEVYEYNPKHFSASMSAQFVLPIATIHEYIYRIYLKHFRESAFVTCRLLDLLVSASRLDTQSCKVLLFCRLLNLPGVDPLHHDAFWFVLKSMHVLQRCCANSGNYFLLDSSGDNEYVPQASAWEALNLLFHQSSNDVLKRLRLRLSGLASVYGAIRLPAYNIIEFIVEEWKTSQRTLQFALKEAILQETDQNTQSEHERRLISHDQFMRVFATLHLTVHRLEAIQAYRHLLSISTKPTTNDSTSPRVIDHERFHQNWASLLLRAINQAQHQQYRSQQHSIMQSSNTASSHDGLYLGPVADAFTTANELCSYRFLKATWEQMRKDLVHRLNQQLNDVGLQVRLVQQIDNVIQNQELDVQVKWRNIQQLIQIVFSTQPKGKWHRG